MAPPGFAGVRGVRGVNGFPVMVTRCLGVIGADFENASRWRGVWGVGF